MRFRDTLYLGMLGLLSGILSASTFDMLEDSALFLPGLLFGIALMLYFTVRREDLRRVWPHLIAWMLLWLVVSTLSYAAAFIYGFLSGILFFAGLIGGGLMLLAVHLFLERLTWWQFGLLILLAGTLALSGLFGPTLEKDYLFLTPFKLNFSAWWLFPVWQAGMAAGIGIVLDRKRSLVKTRPSPGRRIP